MPDTLIFRSPHVEILYAQRAEIESWWWTLRLQSPYWRIYLNDQAGAEVVLADGVHPLTPGRLHVLPAWGDFQARCRGRIVHHFIHVDPGEPLRDIARSALPVAAFFRRPIALAPDRALEDRLRAVAGAPAESQLWHLRAQGVAIAALVACVDLLGAAERATLERGAARDDVVVVAKRYLEDNLHLDLPMARVARHCQVSVSHFGAVFRARTGMTPHRYLQARRVAMAAERLAASATPIDEIAKRCGFANRHHFTRVFTSVVGTPPAAYRRDHRQPAPPA